MTVIRHLRSKALRRRTVCGQDIRAVAYTWVRSAVTCETCTTLDDHGSWDILREHYSGMQSSGFWLPVIAALQAIPLGQTFTAADVKRAVNGEQGPYSTMLAEAEGRGLINIVNYDWIGSRRFKRYRRVV